MSHPNDWITEREGVVFFRGDAGRITGPRLSVLFRATGTPDQRVNASDYVLRHGVTLFRAGSYPNQKFSMNRQELQQAASDFSGFVPLNIEHLGADMTGLSGGRMGYVEKLFVDPEDPDLLKADIAVHRMFDSLLESHERGLSAEWSRDHKKLLGVAVTGSPAIKDAKFAAGAHFSSRSSGGSGKSGPRLDHADIYARRAATMTGAATFSSGSGGSGGPGDVYQRRADFSRQNPGYNDGDAVEDANNALRARAAGTGGQANFKGSPEEQKQLIAAKRETVTGQITTLKAALKVATARHAAGRVGDGEDGLEGIIGTAHQGSASRLGAVRHQIAHAEQQLADLEEKAAAFSAGQPPRVNAQDIYDRRNEACRPNGRSVRSPQGGR